MKFTVLTIFPEMFEGPLTESIIKRAQESEIIEITLQNIRDFATDKHRVTDDTPFGGGGGMVMKAEPLTAAIEAVKDDDSPVILLSPQGRKFDQEMAKELAQYDHLVLVCGRYEGVDERVRDLVITDEISIGDYVLTGGELAAMVLIDAIIRLLPGALGAPHAAAQDSHATGLLEHPHYTRPSNFRDLQVPEVLLNGHHAEIEKWRRQESIRRTWQRRPDMLSSAVFDEGERWWLADLAEETIRSGD